MFYGTLCVEEDTPITVHDESGAVGVGRPAHALTIYVDSITTAERLATAILTAGMNAEREEADEAEQDAS
jgi:hypothetical protein